MTNFLYALTLILIALKLIGKITISWIWVLSPLWISLSVGIIIFLITLLYITFAIRKLHEKDKN